MSSLIIKNSLSFFFIAFFFWGLYLLSSRQQKLKRQQVLDQSKEEIYFEQLRMLVFEEDEKKLSVQAAFGRFFNPDLLLLEKKVFGFKKDPKKEGVFFSADKAKIILNTRQASDIFLSPSLQSALLEENVFLRRSKESLFCQDALFIAKDQTISSIKAVSYVSESLSLKSDEGFLVNLNTQTAQLYGKSYGNYQKIAKPEHFQIQKNEE